MDDDRCAIAKFFNQKHKSNETDLQIAAKLKGEHIPSFIGTLTGSSDGTLGYMQQYCGLNVHAYLKGNKSLLTCDLAVQMFDAIAEFHQLGYIHKDIKFHNFTLKNDRVFIIDYGMAALLSEPQDTSLIGTPHYMSLKAHREEQQNPQCDYESLGYAVLEHFLGPNRWFLKPPYCVLAVGLTEKERFIAGEHSSNKIEKIRRFIHFCAYDTLAVQDASIQDYQDIDPQNLRRLLFLRIFA